jgi:hypothetical protein
MRMKGSNAKGNLGRYDRGGAEIVLAVEKAGRAACPLEDLLTRN